MSSDKNITSNQDVAHVLTEQETKQILTPFAFEIDKSLFGLPLAVPWKRGIALLIDFLCVFLLAETPAELLVFMVAITFFRIGSKKRAQKLGKKRGVRKLILRFIGAFILFVMLVSTVPDFIAQFTQNETKTNHERSQVLEKVPENSTVDVDKKKSENAVSIEETAKDESTSIVYKGIDWFKGLIKDLGLSFGWAVFYFTVLTAVWNGQTPGKKLLKIRVIQLDGTPLSIWDSFGRYGGYAAGLATGLLGFLQIYWDPNRQAIHDKISATVVIDVKKSIVVKIADQRQEEA
ncbi:RDD family protein [Thalassotalea castellviae]|uniref:RDD family protein n=1 Tax=Thalassotalea castellviae TaxID=3075612 RepID=A0ABU2ZWG0_9GAMM|nr:RDD family protein [Thalassotalea sp. W431]MDT0602254.1 RDD family protein [Thalassotalea sp. W431]